LKALESLGSHGSAVCNWRHQLGDDWETCARFLKSTGRAAATVIDPRHPPRHLELMVDGEEDFVAMDEDAGMPPILFNKVRAVIHAGNGLTWSQVSIEITSDQTIHLKAPGQDGAHSFSKRNQLGPEHPLGILMTLAAKGEWRNPPSASPDYERVSKAFQRLQTLLRVLVPLPGKPFQKSAGAFVPIFQVQIHSRLREGGP
jgi:hypothetical protein